MLGKKMNIKVGNTVFMVAVLMSISGIFPLPPSFGSSILPAQDEPKWARYTSDELSVLLPEPPSIALKSRPNKKASARYEGRIYGSYGDGIVYVVISENNPKRAEKLETFIEEFRDGLPRWTSQGKDYTSGMTFDREVIVHGFAGKRYRLKIREAEGIVDFYITERHVYVIESVGGDESNPSIHQFLESLSFESQKTPENRSTADLQATTPSGLRDNTSQNQEASPVFSGKEVTRRAIPVSKPEPSYTAEAREHQVVGTVVLKAILSSSGKVTNIEVVTPLKYGLTEKAIEAAKTLKFIPALRELKFVSQYIQLEYNFNLY